jgi:C_GCAxxG_C_C family probable redox protein
MDRAAAVKSRFLDGYACSQAILSEYGPLFGLDRETALRVSAGFAGGMRRGKTCGAVAGAVMALGLKFCGPCPEKPEDRKRAYDAVQEFMAKFAGEYGCVECRDLLGVDISTAEGLQAAKEKNLFESVCPEFVAYAAELLENMMHPEAE